MVRSLFNFVFSQTKWSAFALEAKFVMKADTMHSSWLRRGLCSQNASRRNSLRTTFKHHSEIHPTDSLCPCSPLLKAVLPALLMHVYKNHDLFPVHHPSASIFRPLIFDHQPPSPIAGWHHTLAITTLNICHDLLVLQIRHQNQMANYDIRFNTARRIKNQR